MLGDSQAIVELSCFLAACLFPRASPDVHLLEVVMFENNDDVWDSPALTAEDGTVRGAMNQRWAISKHVRSGHNAPCRTDASH